MLEQVFSRTRFVYNHYVDIGRRLYDAENRYPTYQENMDTLAALVSQFPFLQETDPESLPLALHNLARAYKNHATKAEYQPPRFKTKNSGRQSYMTKYKVGSKLIANGKINLPVVGAVKIVTHRPIARYFMPLYITVIRKPSWKYEVSIALYAPDYLFKKDMPSNPLHDELKSCVEDSKSNVKKDPNEYANGEVRSIGLDFSLPELLIDSEGHSASYPHFYKQQLKRLSREQRKLAYCVRGSHNYQKQRIRVARMMQRCADQRLDFQHKLSRELSDQYDLVCIEDLAIKRLITDTKFGKSAYDDSWYQFVQMLAYKLTESNKHLQKVSRWYPSSRTCSQCGRVKKHLDLDERIYCCPCGYTASRDVNAAINMKREGERLYRQNAALLPS